MYRVKPKSYAGYTKNTVKESEKRVQNMRVYKILEHIKSGLLASIYAGLLFIAILFTTI